MTLRFWRSWSIGRRMTVITMLPVVCLFTAFVWYSWYSHRAQVTEELAERGRILARALAETSEYNVISGNLSDLRLTINGLVQSDSSIYRIEVVGVDGAQAVRVNSESAIDAQPFHYEAPMAWASRRAAIDSSKRKRLVCLAIMFEGDIVTRTQPTISVVSVGGRRSLEAETCGVPLSVNRLIHTTCFLIGAS